MGELLSKTTANENDGKNDTALTEHKNRENEAQLEIAMQMAMDQSRDLKEQIQTYAQMTMDGNRDLKEQIQTYAQGYTADRAEQFKTNRRVNSDIKAMNDRTSCLANKLDMAERKGEQSREDLKSRVENEMFHQDYKLEMVRLQQQHAVNNQMEFNMRMVGDQRNLQGGFWSLSRSYSDHKVAQTDINRQVNTDIKALGNEQIDLKHKMELADVKQTQMAKEVKLELSHKLEMSQLQQLQTIKDMAKGTEIGKLLQDIKLDKVQYQLQQAVHDLNTFINNEKLSLQHKMEMTHQQQQQMMVALVTEGENREQLLGTKLEKIQLQQEQKVKDLAAEVEIRCSSLQNKLEVIQHQLQTVKDQPGFNARMETEQRDLRDESARTYTGNRNSQIDQLKTDIRAVEKEMSRLKDKLEMVQEKTSRDINAAVQTVKLNMEENNESDKRQQQQMMKNFNYMIENVERNLEKKMETAQQQTLGSVKTICFSCVVGLIALMFALRIF